MRLRQRLATRDRRLTEAEQRVDPQIADQRLCRLAVAIAGVVQLEWFGEQREQLVVGGQEAENDKITVESYFDGKLAELTAVDALAGRMGDEVKRKVARRKAEGQSETVAVTPEKVEEFLGAPYFMRDEEMTERTQAPGVATGLSWTAAGGEVLYIEASQMFGKKGLTLTGQLGEVMKESAQTALSWVRAHARQLGIEDSFFERVDLHLHVPEGAIPKDGPSAGVTIVTALVSLLTGRPVRPRVAMTGEVTLSGKVLPVGGIKEKVLAAHRLGVKEVQDLPPAPERLEHPAQTPSRGRVPGRGEEGGSERDEPVRRPAERLGQQRTPTREQLGVRPGVAGPA